MVGQAARTYIQQLYADTGCSLEDLPGAVDDRDGWHERVREIYASIDDDDDDVLSSPSTTVSNVR